MNGSVSQRDLVVNGAASFLVAWLYFALLDWTDNAVDRGVHYLVLVGGLVLLLGSRLWLDLHYYRIGL